MNRNNSVGPSENSRGRNYLTAAQAGPVVLPGPHSVEGYAPPPVEEPGGIDFLYYWRILLKHKFIILSVLILFIALGIGVTLLTTPIYTATTTIQIDREAAKVLNTQSVEPTEQLIAGEEFFQTQYGLLRSHSLATRVVERLYLAKDGKFLNQMGLEDADNTAARKRKVIAVVSKNMTVSPVRGSRLVKLTFDSPEPKLAALVANAFADSFIETNLERRFEASTYARDFIEDQLARVKGRLEVSEKQLVAYAASQQIINVMDGDAPNGAGAQPTQSLTAANLVAMNQSLAAARNERIRAEQRWAQARNMRGEGIPEVLANPTIQSLTRSRAELSASYQEKLGVYKPEFPAMQQQKAQIAELDRQIQTEIENVRQSIKSQYAVAVSQERQLSGQVEGLKSSVLDLRDRSIQYTILQREVDTNRSQYDALLQRYKDVTVAGGVGTNNVSIVDRAEPPTMPSQPQPLLNLAVAILLGLGIGVLIAVVLELIDETIKTPDDVETKLGLSVLGTIPVLEKGVRALAALDDIRSPFSEAYYSVRTALQFSTPDGAPRTMLITSARPSEGKSTTAIAIAKNFARLDCKVLLVDADLRNPSMHRNLGFENSAGFSNVLTGANYQSMVLDTEMPNLKILVCGPLPPNPAELLSGHRLRTFLIEASAEFDHIIIDGPPIMGLADAPILDAVVDGTVFVIEASGTRRALIKVALERLLSRRSNIIGAVLTKFNARNVAYASGYGYAYEYEYGNAPRITK